MSDQFVKRGNNLRRRQQAFSKPGRREFLAICHYSSVAGEFINKSGTVGNNQPVGMMQTLSCNLPGMPDFVTYVFPIQVVKRGVVLYISPLPLVSKEIIFGQVLSGQRIQYLPVYGNRIVYRSERCVGYAELVELKPMAQAGGKARASGEHLLLVVQHVRGGGQHYFRAEDHPRQR